MYVRAKQHKTAGGTHHDIRHAVSEGCNCQAENHLLHGEERDKGAQIKLPLFICVHFKGGRSITHQMTGDVTDSLVRIPGENSAKCKINLSISYFEVMDFIYHLKKVLKTIHFWWNLYSKCDLCRQKTCMLRLGWFWFADAFDASRTVASFKSNPKANSKCGKVAGKSLHETEWTAIYNPTLSYNDLSMVCTEQYKQTCTHNKPVACNHPAGYRLRERGPNKNTEGQTALTNADRWITFVGT